MTASLPSSVSAQSCGVTAARFLREVKTFKVLAVFERSFYLQACELEKPTIAATVQTPTQNDQSSQTTPGCQNLPVILCINDSTLGLGPLQLVIRNLLLSVSPGLYNGLLKPGTRVLNDITNDTLLLPAGNLLVYRAALAACTESESGSFAEALTSMSGEVLGDDACTSYLSALGRVLLTNPIFFNQEAPERQSHEHLFVATIQWLSDRSGGCLAPVESFTGLSESAKCVNPWQSKLNACCADIEQLHSSITAGASVKQLGGLQSMIGAGNGLTPAGDDFICGVIVALHLNRKADSIEHVSALLKSSALDRTNTISAAHLHEAAAGRLTGRSLAVVEELLALLRVLRESAQDQSTPVSRTAEKLSAACDAIGASSGWDFLAGLIGALVILQPRDRKQPVVASPFLTAHSIDKTSSNYATYYVDN